MVILYNTKRRRKLVKRFKDWHTAMRWVRRCMPHILEDENIFNYVLAFRRGATFGRGINKV